MKKTLRVCARCVWVGANGDVAGGCNCLNPSCYPPPTVTPILLQVVNISDPQDESDLRSPASCGPYPRNKRRSRNSHWRVSSRSRRLRRLPWPSRCRSKPPSRQRYHLSRRVANQGYHCDRRRHSGRSRRSLTGLRQSRISYRSSWSINQRSPGSMLRTS
jgi:hypothetical protein